MGRELTDYLAEGFELGSSRGGKDKKLTHRLQMFEVNESH
jgi:hypothetical protein